MRRAMESRLLHPDSGILHLIYSSVVQTSDVSHSPSFLPSLSPNLPSHTIPDNLGVQVFFSGTVYALFLGTYFLSTNSPCFSYIRGAACEAAKQGIPALAFSGKSTSQVSYSTLTTDPSSPSTLAAQSYASLTTHFINTFLSSPLSSSSFSSSPLLPPQTILNINYPPLFTRPNCSQPSDVTFVLTRAFPTFYKNDVELCANGGRLPVENEVVWDEQGCWASVSVLSAQSKLDFGREGQERVWNALQGLGWGCWKA